MSEWQRHTQESLDVLHYVEILEIIDLQVKASKAVVCKGPKCHSQAAPAYNKTSTQIRTAYVANVDTACMLCGV